MEWQADGTVIARRPHGENAVILQVLTVEYGRCAGMVPGGAGRGRAAMMQPGTRLALRWRGRGADALGHFTPQPIRARAGLLADPLGLAGLNAVCALLAFALPEHDPHPRLALATNHCWTAWMRGRIGPPIIWRGRCCCWTRWVLALI